MSEIIFEEENRPGRWHIAVQRAGLPSAGHIRRLAGGFAYYRGRYNILHPCLEDLDLDALKGRVQALEAGQKL